MSYITAYMKHQLGKPVMIRLAPKMLDEIDRLCEEGSLSRSAIIRQLLAQALARQPLGPRGPSGPYGLAKR